MTQIDQLLAKALSTSSEEEAIACLRMARKKGSTHTATSKPKTAHDSSTYSGHTAKEWCDISIRLKQESNKLLTYYVKLKEDYSNLRTEQLNAVRALEDQKRVTKVIIVIYSICLLSVVTAGYLL